MKIRDALDTDLPDVLSMAADFCAAAGEPFDTEHALTNIAGIRHAGFLLVVENGGNVIGMLGALPVPGMCSPIARFHEVCMWTVPGHRQGHALLLLKREFERRAQAAGVSSVQMSALASSPPALTRIYLRSGYVPADSSFIKRFGST